MILRLSIGIGACAVVLSGCGTAAGPAAETSVAAPTAQRPPPLACEMRSQLFLDHFGIGKGADSPEDAAAPYRARGSTLVVDKGGDAATIHVVSADGEESLAIMGASNMRGWRIDTVESCPDYKPNIARR